MGDFFTINFGDDEAAEKSLSIPKVEDKATQAKRKVERAKKAGLEEMDLFNAAYKEFLEKTKDLVLYKEAHEQIDRAVQSLTDNVLKPILLGKDIYGMPEHVYKDIRVDIFRTLINKYGEENK